MNSIFEKLPLSDQSKIKEDYGIRGILRDIEGEINKIVNNYSFIKNKNITKRNLNKDISGLLFLYVDMFLVSLSEQEYFESLTMDLGNVVRSRLREFLKHIITNLLNNIDNMLFRLHKSYESLMRFFFENEKLNLVNIQLIKPSGFDEDKRLIAILEFNEGKKILYKNSIVALDLCLVGNIKHLSDNCDEFEKISNIIKISALELINNYLEKTIFRDYILPTYKILSFNDSEPKEAYGFMEYLSHDPLINKEFDCQGDINQLIIEELEDQIKKFSGTCDYIVNSEEEGEKFFFRCGVIFAFSRLFHIDDLHGGNFIVHNNTPYIIDIEAAFSQDFKSIKHTNLKDATIFANFANYEEIPKPVFGGGVQFVKKVLKNKIYYYDNNHKLKEYKINKDTFLQGVDVVFQTVNNDNSDLISLLMKLKELNLIRRVIVATENIEITKEYMEFLLSDDGKNVFSKYVLKSINKKAKSGEVGYKECLAFIKSLPEKSRKVVMQTLDENFTKPIFYAYITDRNIVTKRKNILISVKPYNNISGFDVVKSNISDFSEEKLLELHNLIDKYF